MNQCSLCCYNLLYHTAENISICLLNASFLWASEGLNRSLDPFDSLVTVAWGKELKVARMADKGGEGIQV